MSGEVEALGGLVTAGLVANAIDKPVGDHGEDLVRHGDCANCGAPLAGSFCSACGQRAHLHRSIVHVGEEFLHGITHFDGKAWKTLPMLLFHPGKLTRDYIMGRRARYIAPVPLFLLVVFLMFFVFSFVTLSAGGAGATDADGKPLSQAQAIKALPSAEAEVRELDAQIAAAQKADDTGALAGLKGTRIGVVAARDAIKARAAGEVRNPIDLPGAIAEELSGGGGSDLNVDLGNATINQKARKALKNPELVLYKIQGKAYKLSFLLVPLSLPWLWLMFAWKRDVRMYDHAIFALYSISFMSLLFVIGSIAASVGVSFGLFWFMLIGVAPVAHMYVQLKGAYAIGRGAAAWRTAALVVASVITLSLYAMLMIVIGVMD